MLKTELLEHWDDLKVTVIFTQEYDHAIKFFAAEIVATQITGRDFYADRGWTKKDGRSNMDLVYDPHEAESYLAGYVKWDGCQEISFGDGGLHLCGAEDVEHLSQTLIRIFNRCGELMGDKVLEDTFPAKGGVYGALA